MGGNALQIETHRLEQVEYIPLERQVLAQLMPHFARVASIKYYAAKPDFGDMDVLIAKPKPERKILTALLERELSSREVVFNSDYVSFEYQNFQIDLIFVEPEEFEVAGIYFSFNDLGNLMGRVAHKFGLKYGFQGLTSPVKDDKGNSVTDLLLSRDPAPIFDFLGFDFARYQQGFQTLEEIFEYVINSHYFDYRLFDLENLNTINRTRNRKRKTYNLFLAYLEQHNITKSYEFNPDKTSYLPWIADAFPQASLYERLKEVRLDLERRRALAAKFNGQIVMELFPTLNGKALGDFIVRFKKQYPDFEQFVGAASPAQIVAELLDFYSKN